MALDSILNYVPEGYTLREQQKEVLLELERNWQSHDVFVLSMPVGAGKSVCAATLANWAGQASILTPRTILQDQYLASFPKIPSLKGRGKYFRQCPDVIANPATYQFESECFCGPLSEDCPYILAKRAIKESPVAIFNPYSFFLTDIDNKKDNTVIVDEAHRIPDTLRDIYGFKFWDKILPGGCKKYLTIGDLYHSRKLILERIGTVHKHLDERKVQNLKDRFTLFLKHSTGKDKEFFIQHIEGKREPGLEVKPISLSLVSKWYWKGATKLVFMSGTISHKDMEYLGLNKKRIKKIEVGSPIPVNNRPVILLPSSAPMTYANLGTAIPKLAENIQKAATKHAGQKGIVHVSYSIADKLRQYLPDDRYIFHAQDDKELKFQEFKDSTDKVFIAAGFSEGIDLVGDAYTWQIIGKILYPNLSDKFVKYMLDRDQDWYSWETIKTVVQQSGRICRTPTDYGITYVMDMQLAQLVAKNRALFPKYFLEAFSFKPVKDVG